MIRLALAAALLLGSAVLASAQTTLRVGDQKGNSQAAMEAAGVLKDVPYKIEWKEFPAAAPLLEALGAGAIETGLVGDAPFTFAAAANVPVKAIAAVRQSRDGLAVLVPEQSPIKSFDDLRSELLAEYDVGEEQCTEELRALLSDLAKQGLIESGPSTDTNRN